MGGDVRLMINKIKSFGQSINEDYENKKILFFIRNTSKPLEDLERGFSCEVNSWVNSEEEAVSYQKRHGAIAKPKFDKVSKKWCADPELGLSSFGFYNEKTFNEAIIKMEQYAYDEKIALFVSSDFNLDAGADSEDVFRSGEFLTYITFETAWEEIFKKFSHKL